MLRNTTNPGSRHALLRAAMLAFVVLSLICRPPAVTAQERPFVWEGELRDGATLAVHTVHGTLIVRRAAGRVARLTGTSRSEGRAAAEIRFDVQTTGDTIVVCALYAQASDCDTDGLRSQRWPDGRGGEGADLVLELPTGVHLHATSGSGAVSVSGATASVHAWSGNGDVRVEDGAHTVTARSGNGVVHVRRVIGPVHASSGNGRIEVATRSGPVQARTGNGDIVVSMAGVEGNDDMEFRTYNGSITVELPHDFSGQLAARAEHGRIASDFPVNGAADALENGRLNAVIGQGGPLITLRTTNGRIRLRRTDH